jgi:hypothetical protein
VDDVLGVWKRTCCCGTVGVVDYCNEMVIANLFFFSNVSAHFCSTYIPVPSVESSKSVIDILMLLISNITPTSLARNSGSSIVPFIMISVCKSFALNAFTISIFFGVVIL